VEHIGHYAIANSLLYPVKEVMIGGEVPVWQAGSLQRWLQRE
jgi:hypothetical protein